MPFKVLEYATAALRMKVAMRNTFYKLVFMQLTFVASNHWAAIRN